jgi:predicted RNase H-like nuclease (RuvC/YqgF family)
VVLRPAIDRLTKEIKDLEQLCAEHENSIQEMKSEMASYAAGATDDQDEDRQKKIEKIIQLEDVYRQVLAEKEADIARAVGESFD